MIMRIVRIGITDFETSWEEVALCWLSNGKRKAIKLFRVPLTTRKVTEPPTLIYTKGDK